jgi:hypothetical protein
MIFGYFGLGACLAVMGILAWLLVFGLRSEVMRVRLVRIPGRHILVSFGLSR